jgi:hypothetical protein
VEKRILDCRSEAQDFQTVVMHLVDQKIASLNVQMQLGQRESSGLIDCGLRNLKLEFRELMNNHAVQMNIPEDALIAVRNSFESKFLEFSARIQREQEQFLTSEQVKGAFSQLTKKCKELSDANSQMLAEIQTLRQEKNSGES